MATETWEYEIYKSGEMYLTKSQSKTMQIKRTSPSNLPTVYTIKSATIRTNGSTFIATYANIKLGFKYKNTTVGVTAQLAKNENMHAITGVSMSKLKDALLSVGKSYEDITVYIDSSDGGTGNAICMKNTAFILTVQVQCIYYSPSTVTAPSTSYFGDTHTFTLSNTSGEGITHLRHNVVWKFGGGQQQTIPLGAGVTTFSITPNDLSQYVNTSQVTCYVYVQTICADNNANVGSQVQAPYLVVLKGEYKPSISSFYASPNGGTTWSGIYVQGYTTVRLSATAATHDTYAQIATYSFSVTSGADGTVLYNSGKITSSTVNIPKYSGAGQQTATVVVEDTRGRTSTLTCKFNVLTYTKPVIYNTLIYFGNSDGVANTQGAYIWAKGTASVCSLNGNNSVTSFCTYYGITSNPASVLATNMLNGVLYSKAISSQAYNTIYVKYVVQDALSSTEQVMQLARAPYAIHVAAGGYGVQFGDLCQATSAKPYVQITPKWDLRLWDDINDPTNRKTTTDIWSLINAHIDKKVTSYVTRQIGSTQIYQPLEQISGRMGYYKFTGGTKYGTCQRIYTNTVDLGSTGYTVNITGTSMYHQESRGAAVSCLGSVGVSVSGSTATFTAYISFSNGKNQDNSAQSMYAEFKLIIYYEKHK